MGLTYVVKVQYGDILRRLELKESELDFPQLEIRTRDLLQIAPTAQLVFTYTDRDGDNITMGDDQDLLDAVVLQSLNPLDVSVEIVGTKINAQIVQGQSFNTHKEPAKQEEKVTTEKDKAGGMEAMAKDAENRSTVDTEEAAGAPKLSPVAADSTTPRNSDVGASDEKCGTPIHYGISCDICGTCPVKGPRFKSTIKFDYDLCEACFETHDSSPGEYIKIDRSFNRLRYPLHRGRTIQMRRPPGLSRRCGPRGIPSLCFDTVFGFHHFDVDEPHEIRPVVVVNRNVMPPFCRVSHPTFGHYVCVAGEEKTSHGTKDKATKTEEQKKTEKVHSRSGEPDMKLGDDTNVATKAGENIERTNKEAATEAAEDRISNSSTPGIAGSHGVVNEARAASKHEPQHDLSRKEELVAKLATMGFSDRELNFDMLERNKLDLRKTVDDLLAAEEWDAILEDLQEMGFRDRIMNRGLLFKYDGNVKAVVKELVQASNLLHGKGAKRA